MMEIEVTVTLKDLDELTAEIQKMAEETRAKILSGEIEAEPEGEPCDCPGCTPHPRAGARRAGGWPPVSGPPSPPYRPVAAPPWPRGVEWLHGPLERLNKRLAARVEADRPQATDVGCAGRSGGGPSGSLPQF